MGKTFNYHITWFFGNVLIGKPYPDDSHLNLLKQIATFLIGQLTADDDNIVFEAIWGLQYFLQCIMLFNKIFDCVI